jgi:hypothetical protein
LCTPPGSRPFRVAIRGGGQGAGPNPTFRFSGLGTIVRPIPLTCAICANTSIRTLMNAGERRWVRPKMRPRGIGWASRRPFTWAQRTHPCFPFLLLAALLVVLAASTSEICYRPVAASGVGLRAIVAATDSIDSRQVVAPLPSVLFTSVERRSATPQKWQCVGPRTNAQSVCVGRLR